MSRPLQTALAGPSTLRHLASPRSAAIARPRTGVAALQVNQQRSVSFGGFNALLPSFLRSDRKSETSTTPAASSSSTDDATSGGLFDEVAKEAEQVKRARKKQLRAAKQHDVRSPEHKISLRKLNDLGRQVAELPVGEAIVQMQFSQKRASQWIQPILMKAREDAVKKGLNRDKLVVAESWVAKGSRLRRIDIKGRGRAGIKNHNYSKIYFRLKEGKTLEEKEAKKFARELELVRSAGVVREDGVIRRKVISGWTW